jgi:hypothetical protein
MQARIPDNWGGDTDKEKVRGATNQHVKVMDELAWYPKVLGWIQTLPQRTLCALFPRHWLFETKLNSVFLLVIHTMVYEDEC